MMENEVVLDSKNLFEESNGLESHALTDGPTLHLSNSHDESHPESSAPRSRNNTVEGWTDGVENDLDAATVLASSAPISSSSLTASSLTTSVHPQRKEELLLEAREDRCRWILKVPLPYSVEQKDPNDPWTFDQRLTSFRQSHACVPSAIDLLATMYGGMTVLGDRVKLLIDTTPSEGSAIPTGEQILAQELARLEGDNVLKSYSDFLSALQDPACATLVQTTRRFCANIVNIEDPKVLSSQIKLFLASSFTVLKSHTIWKDIDTKEESIWQSFESFIYGHCFPHIDSILWTREASERDRQWLERLELLQFVQPKHLEIYCLDDSQDIEDLLAAPIESLRLVERFYSPHGKLNCVLSLYKNVNAVLKRALNRLPSSDSTHQKMPTADDVLPTIILVLLKAKPARLLTNLQFVEDWSSPEYLRGEAGYAYTNLYGAVHFLQELDLDEPNSLQISPDEFRKGLEASRHAAASKGLHQKSEQKCPQPSTETLSPPEKIIESHISPREVREARLRGETTDAIWAHRLWSQSTQTDQQASAESAGQTERRSAFDEATEILPTDFNRHYTFLNSRPEDIRLSDLPQLLSEYRLLVRTTEQLIADRASKIAARRKEESAKAELDLFARIRSVDPSLLPSTNGSKT